MRLTSLLLMVLAMASTAEAGSKRHMVNHEMRLAFEGITLDGVYKDGLFFSETYFEDGLIRYHDVQGADSGEWTVEDDTFCTFYASQTGACFFVVRDGENCFSFFEAVEDEHGGIFPANEWTSRGWNREMDPTCEKPPEAEV